MEGDRILLTGANGQIGTELTIELQKIYGEDNVIATDIREPSERISRFEILDILDSSKLDAFIAENKISQVYHLAALLSSKGEENPAFTWKLNFDAYIKLLEIGDRKSVV